MEHTLKNPKESIKTHQKYKNTAYFLELGNKQYIGHIEGSILLINENFNNYFCFEIPLNQFLEKKEGYLILLINPEYSEEFIKIEYNSKKELYNFINILHTFTFKDMEGFIKGVLALATDNYLTEKGGLN